MDLVLVLKKHHINHSSICSEFLPRRAQTNTCDPLSRLQLPHNIDNSFFLFNLVYVLRIKNLKGSKSCSASRLQRMALMLKTTSNIAANSPHSALQLTAIQQILFSLLTCDPNQILMNSLDKI